MAVIKLPLDVYITVTGPRSPVILLKWTHFRQCSNYIPKTCRHRLTSTLNAPPSSRLYPKSPQVYKGFQRQNLYPLCCKHAKCIMDHVSLACCIPTILLVIIPCFVPDKATASSALLPPIGDYSVT